LLGGAVETRDAGDAAVRHGTLAHPRLEHGLDGQLKLLERVLREDLADVALVDLLVAFAEIDHALLGHVGVFACLVLGLDLAERVLEVLMPDAHHDIAEHVDQPAIRVVGEAAVLGPRGEAFNGDVREPEVEDRVHHAGHGDGRAGAD
jgi:hypothetical protein